MRQFDPEEALRLIDKHKITTSQWVPTHFRRLVRLPEEVKEKYDVSSLRVAVHAAAPCPIPLKEQMIEWWGNAIVEYYAGTEGGGTLIRADEWIKHKGSVGRPLVTGAIHILDDDGQAITEAGEQLSDNREVRAVVLSGNGRCFCAGLDMATFKQFEDRDSTTSSSIPIASPGERPGNLAQRACLLWKRLPVELTIRSHW